MTSRPILLFKEPSPDNEYENVLQEKGYEAKCIPVLQTTTTNTDLFLEYLVNAEVHDLRGVVITSKRSCDSLAEALAKLCSQSSEDVRPALAYWSNAPFYVVGEATAASVREVQQRYQDYGFTTVRTLGESSGTGEKLGHFIVEHRSSEAGSLLYLTGDKNRDTVALILSKNGIPFQALRVYETSQRSDFGSLLETAIDSLSSSANHDFWWTVYFAPSTAKFAVPAARQLLQSKGIANRIGSIGPVTTSSIEKDCGASVDVTAPRPDASALAESILAYDRYQV